MRNPLSIIVAGAIGLSAISCQKPAKATVKKQTIKEKTHIVAKEKHPEAIDFQSEAFDDIFKRDGFTIEVQDRIAENPKQIYWASSDDFGIYRTPKGIFIFLSVYRDCWLELRCSKENASNIVQMNKEFPKVKLMLFFSLDSAFPVHVEMKGGYDPGTPRDEDSEPAPPMSFIETADVQGNLFKGELTDMSLLEFDRKKDFVIESLFPKEVSKP